MESDDPPARGRPAETRATILRVAIEAFGRDGFLATSVQEIAVEANVTKGAVYHYFGSKEDLFRAVRDAVEESTIVRSRQAADLEGSPVDHMKAGLAAFLDGALDRDAQRILFVDAPVFLSDRHTAQTTRGVEEFRDVLLRAIADGLIRPVDATAMATLISGACQAGARLIAASQDPAKTRTEVGAALVALIDGLATAPG